LQCRLEALAALGVFWYDLYVFLEDDLLGRGRTNHPMELAPVGRSPGGSARRA
jgi:hypothetical protein